MILTSLRSCRGAAAHLHVFLNIHKVSAAFLSREKQTGARPKTTALQPTQLQK